MNRYRGAGGSWKRSQGEARKRLCQLLESGQIQKGIPESLPESVVDEMEVARCSCGLVFYSADYALNHICLGASEDEPS